MLRDFNLLVTTTRRHEAEVCSEIWYFLGEIGDDAALVDKTGISGLAVAKTSFPPLLAIKKLRRLLTERPNEFLYTLRVIPIQKVVDADIRVIERTITELANTIKTNETFRVTIEKRHTTLSSRDLIEAAAANIERRVDLTDPDKIVLVEVVGGYAGISIVKPSDIISTAKERFKG